MNTPRTDAAWRKYYDESADEMDMKELMSALEHELNEEKANCRQAGVEALMQRDDLLKELAEVTAERGEARAAHCAELANMAQMNAVESATLRARVKELEVTLEEAIDERANMYEWRTETNPDRWVRDGLCVKWRATINHHKL